MFKLENLRHFVQRHYRGVALCFLILSMLTVLLENSFLMIPEPMLFIHGGYLPWLVFIVAVAILWPIFAASMCCTWLIFWILTPQFKKLAREKRERKYADYIMRRFLMQLELAMLSMPRDFQLQQLLHDPTLCERYQLAKDAAYEAVNKFRRDASKLMLTSCPLCLLVLPEEEQLLAQGGYARIDLRVSKEYLRHLLHPQTKGSEAL